MDVVARPAGLASLGTRILASDWCRPSLPPLHRLMLLMIAVGVGAYSGIELTREAGRIASLWPPNGVVLAVLLTVRKRSWLAYLGAGLTGNMAAGIISGDAWWLALTLSLYNYLEIAFIAVCLRPNDAAAIRKLATRTQLVEFFCLASGGAILSAGLAASTLNFWFDADATSVLRRWFLADFLGLAIVTPLAMAVHQGLRSEKPTLPKLLQNSAIAALIAAMSAIVFTQQSYPLLFLLLPPILLAVQRCGSIGAAGGVGILAVISIGFTVEGRGPFNLIPGSGMEQRVLVLQFFLLTTALLALWANAQRYERLRLEQALRDSEASFRLLTEHASDVVSRVTADGLRSYVSPAALRVYGATPADLVGSKLIDRIDPRDRPALKQVVERLLAGSWDENAKLEYRVRHPVFRKTDRWGSVEQATLHPNALPKILARRLAKAGLTASGLERLSAHGLRVGFITEAYKAGANDEAIMEHSRHKDVRTMRGYVRRDKLVSDSPAGWLGCDHDRTSKRGISLITTRSGASRAGG